VTGEIDITALENSIRRSTIIDDVVTIGAVARFLSALMMQVPWRLAILSRLFSISAWRFR
jgi:hypothetical protein